MDPVLIGCLVDCSVAVLDQWSDLWKSYMTPICLNIALATKRTGIPEAVRVGIITYGNYESLSPICSRRFFTSTSTLKEDMLADPYGLGLGRVASTTHGMSVLEGYVAMLEMFDQASILKPRQQPQVEGKAFEPILYLLHVAFAGPDGATKPAFNTNPALDNITWETLPAEISKRNIRYNLVLLNDVPELVQFSTSINGTTDSFGINVRKPTHKLSLAGLPAQGTKTVPQKRVAPDQDEESLKSRRQVPQGHGDPSIAKSPPVIAPAIASSAPSAPPQQGIRSNMGQLRAFIINLEKEIQAKSKELEESILNNAPQERIETLRHQVNTGTQNRAKLIVVFKQMLLRSQIPQGTAGLAPQPVAGSSSQLVAGPNVNAQPQPLDSSNNMNHTAAAKTNQFPNTPARTMGGAGIDVQLAKMFAERSRPPVLAAAPQIQNHPQALPAPLNAERSQTANATGQAVPNFSPDEVAQILDTPMHINNFPKRWEGAISWTSLQSRKDLTMQVAFFSGGTDLNTDDWPKRLALQLSSTRLNYEAIQAIQAGPKQFRPTMGFLVSLPSAGNLEISLKNYNLFNNMRELLQTRGTFGIMQLDVPSSPPGAGIIFLPIKAQASPHLQRALLAMVFFRTPIPPNFLAPPPPPNTQLNAAGPSNQMPIQMPPTTQAYLQQQRDTALAAYNQQQALTQRQAMLPTAGNPLPNVGITQYNMNQFQGMQGAQAQQQQGGIQNNNQGILGGVMGFPPQSSSQQAQLRQTSGGYTPSQIAMMQFGMTRPQDGAQ